MFMIRARPLVVALGACVLAAVTAACGGDDADEPPVASVSLMLSSDRAAAGSPLQATYRFVPVENAVFAENFRVMVHLTDVDGELMWTDDHDPPIPTTQWKPGETIEYTRLMFVPILPYVGEARLQVGLHSIKDQRRLPLAAEHVGQREYRVARLQLLPQTENVFTVFKDGWHPAEVASDNAQVEWQWTKKEATLAFRNPKQPITVYLDADNPTAVFADGQRVQVLAGSQAVDEFVVKPRERLLRKIPVRAEQLGDGDMAEIRLAVDKTFVPAEANLSPQDKRELGVRVFHVFVEPVK
jgi:hypothetical protein